MNHQFGKLLLPSLIVFLFVSSLLLLLPNVWMRLNINYWVVLMGNGILFGLSTLTLYMHINALKNPNPNVFSNSVMGGTMLKLFVLGFTVVIYLLISGKNRSVFAIFICMFLYIIYTVFDVKTALRLNKK
jgi:hypothetical protein